MRASTAFLVGVGTVGLAIAGGLGGGLMIADMMSPSPPQHETETARLKHLASPQPMPAASALSYAAATLAFTDPSIDGSAPPAGQRADSGSASLPPASVAAAMPSEQETKPADSVPVRPSTQEAQQAPPAKQATAPEDAYAKARDSDLKHAADRRRAERAQRWADRYRRDQDQNRSSEQQTRDDRNSSDGPARYSYTYSDRRYRDGRSDRYRDAERGAGDDRALPYYVDQAPRFDLPRIQLFGPDD